MRVCGVLVLSVALCACSAVSPVQPWQRDYLARPEMAWQPDVQLANQRGHVYFSKEASSGGASASGGGCGCN